MNNNDVEIISRDGRRRRMRKGEVLQDGEVMSIPPRMAFFDGREVADYLATKYSAAVHVVDAAGIPAGNKPGFLRDGALDRLQDAAAVAYEQRSAYLRNAWRTKDESLEPAHDTRTPDQAATDAYEQKKQRLADAWKTR